MSVAAERSAVRTVARAWQSVPLRELCEFYNGLWKGKKGPFETATVIRNSNFTSDGRIDLTNVAVLDVESRQLAKRRLKRNDIIIEKSGGGPKQPVGRVVLFDLDTGDAYSFSNFTSVIRVADAKVVDPVYLHRVLYWWYTSGRTESIQSHSTGIRNLDFNAYKELSVPLPPLEEQKRIVAVLDQAFAALDRARAHAEANLADATELARSVVTQEINTANPNGATETTLGNLCAIARGGSPRPIKRFLTDDDDGVNWIKISDATASGQFIEQTKQRIIREGVSRSRYVEPGAFLLTNSMSFGRPYVLRTSGCIHDGWLVLEPDYKRVDQDYLYYLLGSSEVYGKFDRAAAGSTVRNLNIRLVSEIPVSLPTIEEQREIAARIEGAFKRTKVAEDAYQRKLADIAALRQSLLQKAFAGELT